MDDKQAAYAAKMYHWDNLDSKEREKFRSLDLDFFYPMWMQCNMLFSGDDRFKMYKKYYDSQ